MIAIHVKWLEKHLIAKLPVLPALQPAAFDKTRALVTNIVQSKQHPLHRLRKRFAKSLTNFQPFYDAVHIDIHNKTTIVSQETSLCRTFGAAPEPETIRRRLAIAQDPEVVALKVYLASVQSNCLTKTCAPPDPLVQQSNEEGQLSESVAKFISRSHLAQHDDDATFDVEKSFVHLLTKLEHLEGVPKTDRFVCDMLPIREYIALKSLNRSLQNNGQPNELSRQFFEAIASIGVAELQLVNTLNEDTFSSCESLWADFWHIAKTGQTPLVELIAELPANFYRNYATCRRNLTATQQVFAMRSLVSKPDAEVNDCLWAGPIFTSAALAAIFDPASGNSKTCGLAELESWQNSLQQFAQLLWNNGSIFQSHFSFE